MLSHSAVPSSSSSRGVAGRYSSMATQAVRPRPPIRATDTAVLSLPHSVVCFAWVARDQAVKLASQPRCCLSRDRRSRHSEPPVSCSRCSQQRLFRSQCLGRPSAAGRHEWPGPARARHFRLGGRPPYHTAASAGRSHQATADDGGTRSQPASGGVFVTAPPVACAPQSWHV